MKKIYCCVSRHQIICNFQTTETDFCFLFFRKLHFLSIFHKSDKIFAKFRKNNWKLHNIFWIFKCPHRIEISKTFTKWNVKMSYCNFSVVKILFHQAGFDRFEQKDCNIDTSYGPTRDAKETHFSFTFTFSFLKKRYFAFTFSFTFPKNAGNEKRKAFTFLHSVYIS